MRVRLTPAIVRSAKPQRARMYLWDSEVPGLGLVVHPSGKRSWVFQGPATGGRRVKLQVAGLPEARKVAVGIRTGLLAAGAYMTPAPSAERVLTVNDLLDEWLRALSLRPHPPSSLPRIRACLANHVRDRIGHIPFASLSRSHVLSVRDALAARGLRGMANQVTAYLRAAFRWAEDARLIPEAPRWRVSRLRLGSRAHALTEEEWNRLLAVLCGAEGLHPVGRLALLALTLTGCRKGEIASLRWEDVTQDGGLRLLRHKTSTQIGAKHIPGSLRLAEVLALARKVSREVAEAQPTQTMRDAILRSPYVFPSIARNGIGKPIGSALDKTWVEVRRRAALPPQMTIHGLRGAFITQAQRLGVPIATVAALVGHESPLTTLRHYTAPSRIEVAEAASHVAEWIRSRA